MHSTHNHDHSDRLQHHSLEVDGKIMLLSPELAHERIVEAVKHCALIKHEAEQRVKGVVAGSQLR